MRMTYQLRPYPHGRTRFERMELLLTLHTGIDRLTINLQCLESLGFPSSCGAMEGILIL